MYFGMMILVASLSNAELDTFDENSDNRSLVDSYEYLDQTIFSRLLDLKVLSGDLNFGA
jgi:hypothetical protein